MYTLAVDSVNTVPVEFWYSTTIILVAVLVWVIQKYFASLSETITEIKKNLTSLTTMMTVHEKEIQDLKIDVAGNSTDIKDLQKKRVR
jgi:hypothetical protein